MRSKRGFSVPSAYFSVNLTAQKFKIYYKQNKTKNMTNGEPPRMGSLEYSLVLPSRGHPLTVGVPGPRTRRPGRCPSACTCAQQALQHGPLRRLVSEGPPGSDPRPRMSEGRAPPAGPAGASPERSAQCPGAGGLVSPGNPVPSASPWRRHSGNRVRQGCDVQPCHR